MRNFFIAFLFACGTNSIAQEVVVKSFEYLPTDLTARTQEILDANGNSCAVVKVDIPIEDMLFKGWVVETVSTPGEYLVYMPEGSTKITMQHKTLTPFTYEFDKPLTGKNTYRLVVLIKRADSSKPVYKVIEVSEEIKDSYNQGVSLLAQNKKDEANKLIQDAANAGYAPAQFKYGQILSDKEAVTWYQKAASQGYADAICALGDIYMQGKKVPCDAERAFKYYIEAIDLNSSKAMLHVGECFENGEGTPQDMGKAFWYYKKAAELGEVSAYSKVAHCFWEGIGIKKSGQDAIAWYTNGCEKGDAISCLELGKYYEDSNLSYSDHNDDTSNKMYRAAAEKGIAEAQVMVGNRFRSFFYDLWYKGEKKAAVDYLNEALSWYHKAADQGDKRGLEIINMYEQYKSLKSPAEKGDDKAQYNLGIIYLDNYNGIVPPDIQEGISWLNKSGKQKNIEALIKLGDLYYRGLEIGVYTCDTKKPSGRVLEFSQSKNYPEAVRYYVQAAELGNFYAQFQLGDMYSYGEYGLKTDYSEAVKWYLRAATHDINNPNSESDIGQYKPNKDNISSVQYQLGQLYMRKEIGKEKEGLKWIRKAAENGNASAKRWLDVNQK